MKTIIILGEEYWFEIPGTQFTEATYLLNFLKKHNDTRFKYEILKNPSELTPTIEKIKKENIRGIFLFQDVLTDSYLNNKSIINMRKYLNDLQDSGVFIYPPPNIIDIFGSKKYNDTLNKEIPWASLPKTRVVKFENYHPKKEDDNVLYLWSQVQEMWKDFEKVVIKKGYSYEGVQVQIFNRTVIKNFEEFKTKAHKLNKKFFWNKARSAIPHEIGVDRYYILQGFNRIVSKRENEYRVFFHNGKARFIARGTGIPNTCLEDEEKKPLTKKIINFAKKLYKAYIPLFWTFNKNIIRKNPILFRVDVSYAIDPEFQDEYSVNIKGFDKPIRIYANELEIDPTNFFFNKFICESNKEFASKIVQKNMGKYIRKYINIL
jgi:hypothetical protein